MTAIPRDAVGIAAAVRAQRLRAIEVAEAALRRIEIANPHLNAFVHVLAQRARREAEDVDARCRRGENPGPLAGVPYAVKSLFDIEGVRTLAGAKIEADAAPAARDATAVTRLKQAGAVLVGTLNMDEYAYGFTTENAHYGTTRNPHDLSCLAGGSSGGSAAAVAAALVPLALGTDTNGSIRVPASLCGVFGLKPTYGRLSRAGAFPFAWSLDQVGPFARSVQDLAACYDVLQGDDSADPVSAGRPLEPATPGLSRGADGLRIGIARGYFAPEDTVLAQEAVARAAAALGPACEVTIPEAEAARAAAFLITAAEGASFHLGDLQRRVDDFDPATRDRFLAGALIPSTWLLKAQRFRNWYRDQFLTLFRNVDIILAPATPGPAPRIGEKTMRLGGTEVAVSAGLGIFTQPLSLVGPPICVVPMVTSAGRPIGVQIVAAPWREADVLRVASALERSGLAAPPVADGFRPT